MPRLPERTLCLWVRGRRWRYQGGARGELVDVVLWGIWVERDTISISPARRGESSEKSFYRYRVSLEFGKEMRGLAANLSFFFKDRPFIERFAASRAAGFRAVEFMFAGDGKYACDSADVRRALEENELEQALLNAPAGDWLNGERGIGGIAARESDWKASFEYGLRFAQDVRCSKMHIMAGLISHGATEDVYVERLRWASRIAADVGVCICVEPLNPTDFPGYLVPDVSSALRILERVDAPGHCQLQLDLYHVAMVEGTDLTSVIRRALPHTAHVQIANPPGRNEPGVGVIDFPPLLALLGELGYRGWVGCEYKPSTPITEQSLEWARAAGWLTGVKGRVYGVGDEVGHSTPVPNPHRALPRSAGWDVHAPGPHRTPMPCNEALLRRAAAMAAAQEAAAEHLPRQRHAEERKAAAEKGEELVIEAAIEAAAKLDPPARGLAAPAEESLAGGRAAGWFEWLTGVEGRGYGPGRYRWRRRWRWQASKQATNQRTKQWRRRWRRRGDWSWPPVGYPPGYGGFGGGFGGGGFDGFDGD